MRPHGATGRTPARLPSLWEETLANRKDKQIRRAAAELAQAFKAPGSGKVIAKLVKREYLKAPHRARFGGVAVAREVVRANIQAEIDAQRAANIGMDPA